MSAGIQSIALIALSLIFSPVLAGPVAEQGKSVLDPAPADRPNRKMSDSDRARHMTNDYATCVAKLYPRQVERAVVLSPALSYDALAKLATSECLVSGELFIPNQLMRGAVYRALYIRDYRKHVPAFSTSAVDYAGSADGDPHSQELARLNNFGSCVAVANPAAARSLVLANAATDEEAGAIDALRQNLADCLPGGTSVKFTKGVLQGLLAEILYREANILTDPAQESH